MSEWIEGKPTKPEEVEYVRCVYWNGKDGTYEGKVLKASVESASGVLEIWTDGWYWDSLYWNDQIVAYKLKEGRWR